MSIKLVSTPGKILYHGSNQVVQNPRLIPGIYTKDFGVAFYCTEIREQAIRWAIRKSRGTRGYLFKFKILGNTDGLRVKQFRTTSHDWLVFIAQCRKGIPHNYDVVIGPVADDTIYDYVNAYLAGDLSEKEFLTLAKFKNPTHQIAFCTENALRVLTYMGYEPA